MKTSGILGIILARGGSKRLPRKNLALLGGKPLLAYTCAAAKGSRLLTRTVLSTDDGDIAALGRTCGVEVPFPRPAELAGDSADSIAVVRHVLRELREREGYRPGLVVLLQPTSPLRTSADIDAGIELLQATGADSVVSVTEVPHVFHAGKGREPAEKVYAHNGAVYVLRTDRLEDGTDPYGSDCRPLVMDRERSLDIDTDADLALGEFLLRQTRHANGR